MDIWKNDIWLELFGKVWPQLIAAESKIGAFAVLHNTSQVLIDDNATALLGVKKTPSYQEVLSVLQRLQKNTMFSSPLQIHLLDTGEDITAGFVLVEEDISALKVSDSFPIASQEQLLRQMGEDSGISLLALLQLEGVSNSSLTASCVSSALNAIQAVLPEHTILAAHSLLQYWIYVPDFSGDALTLLEGVQNAVKECVLTDEFGITISDYHTMTVSAGCCLNLENTVPAQRLHTASFALFEAMAKGAGSIRFFSEKQYELQKNEYHDVKVFSQLIEQNLFSYHFQPIVDAHNGEIVAYEALMRTDESIGLNPFQILNLAERFNRLYDIEKATLRNTLTILSNNQEVFEKRKLYINTIPAHILTEQDYNQLRADFGELLEKVVIELTEQTEISDDALSRIHARLKDDHMHLAIDDYGTGYSNTSNLLRYNPDIVKIDRSLISNIDSNHKTQKIVAGIIDFLHASGYMALAEGVETYEELQCMIQLSADLIQGYYVSRPKPVLLHEISGDIRKEIVRINMEISGEVQRIYHPVDSETIDLRKLTLEKYTDIFIDVSNVTLIGEKDQTLSLVITVKDDIKCDILLKDVNIISVTDAPVLKLGSNCDVRIICEGDNKFTKKGIRVPRTSSLRISGAGSLAVNSEMLNCCAIGTDKEHSHGNITIDMTGHLDISANGESCIGIGGGKNKDNNRIKISGGDISISCSGGTCVGIGCIEGPALIDMVNCRCCIQLNSPSAISIGAVTGFTDISIQNFRLELTSSGTNQAGIGVIHEGTGKVSLTDGKLYTTLKGMNLSCIGTRDGAIDSTVKGVTVSLYCEGTSVSGIGDIGGSGDVYITNSELSFTFLAGSSKGLGTRDGKLEVVRCNTNFDITE